MKINKNIKIFFNYFLGPILFVWLCWSIYHQIRNQHGVTESWQQIKASLNSAKIIYLVLVFLLMFLNWIVEAYKWRLAIMEVQPISFFRAFKAILSGVSFSVSTPNRVGEYVGRILYIDEGKRIKVVTLTVISSLSQLIITIIMGIAGLFLLKDDMIAANMVSAVWFDVILYGTLFCLLVLLLFYFRISWMVQWIDKLPASKKFSWSIEALEHFNATLLFRFLSLSVTRFFIFILQYYLLFQLFEVEMGFWQTWLSMSVVFLILAIVPTIAIFTDLSIRSTVSLTVLGLFSNNQLGISLSSIGIWLINLVVPALIGSVLVLGIHKIFKNKNETV